MAGSYPTVPSMCIMRKGSMPVSLSHLMTLIQYSVHIIQSISSFSRVVTVGVGVPSTMAVGFRAPFLPSIAAVLLANIIRELSSVRAHDFAEPSGGGGIVCGHVKLAGTKATGGFLACLVGTGFGGNVVGLG